MLKIEDDEAHHCLILRPAGALTRADIDGLVRRFDAKVAATGRPPNLVIQTPGIPTWTDLGALRRHLGFIRGHHRMVGRLAFVSDSRALDIGPRLARFFVEAELRRFPSDALDAALAWVAEDADSRPPNVSVMPDLPDDTLGISVHGVVTAHDYAREIEPLIEAKLAEREEIKLIYRIGPEFERFTPGAMWRDAKVGMKNLDRFSKIAVVSDVRWIRHAVQAFAPLISAEVEVFADDEMATAKAWVAG